MDGLVLPFPELFEAEVVLDAGRQAFLIHYIGLDPLVALLGLLAGAILGAVVVEVERGDERLGERGDVAVVELSVLHGQFGLRPELGP